MATFTISMQLSQILIKVVFSLTSIRLKDALIQIYIIKTLIQLATLDTKFCVLLTKPKSRSKSDIGFSLETHFPTNPPPPKKKIEYS